MKATERSAVSRFIRPAPTNQLAIANPWQMVPTLGNLDAYIRAANHLSMLTAEEEQKYARRLPAPSTPWMAKTFFAKSTPTVTTVIDFPFQIANVSIRVLTSHCGAESLY